MDTDSDFGHLTQAFERFTGEFEKARAERVSSETLIASAEYELEQVKKSFAGAKLDTEPIAPPILRRPASAAFAGKLRKPENLEDPKWRAILGLSQ